MVLKKWESPQGQGLSLGLAVTKNLGGFYDCWFSGFSWLVFSFGFGSIRLFWSLFLFQNGVISEDCRGCLLSHREPQRDKRFGRASHQFIIEVIFVITWFDGVFDSAINLMAPISSCPVCLMHWLQIGHSARCILHRKVALHYDIFYASSSLCSNMPLSCSSTPSDCPRSSCKWGRIK